MSLGQLARWAPKDKLEFLVVKDLWDRLDALDDLEEME